MLSNALRGFLSLRRTEGPVVSRVSPSWSVSLQSSEFTKPLLLLSGETGNLDFT